MSFKIYDSNKCKPTLRKYEILKNKNENPQKPTYYAGNGNVLSDVYWFLSGQQPDTVFFLANSVQSIFIIWMFTYFWSFIYGYSFCFVFVIC